MTLPARKPRRDDGALLDKSWMQTALGPEVDAWLDWLEVGGFADKTLDQYERDLSRLCKTFPRKRLDKVTDADLLQVIATFPKPSRRVRKAAYDSFFKWAIRTRRIEKNPCDLLPQVKRTPQKVIDVFSDAECDDLTSLPDPDGTLMLLMLDAGPRKADCRQLQVRRCKVDTGELVFVAGKGGKDRIVLMTFRLQKALQGLLQVEQFDPKDYLWACRPGGGRTLRRSQPIGDGSFDRWWKAQLDRADVRYRNPHVARHTFATRWLRRGGRLETLSLAMGHASFQTTADLYAHLNTKDMAVDIKVIQASHGKAPD